MPLNPILNQLKYYSYRTRRTITFHLLRNLFATKYGLKYAIRSTVEKEEIIFPMNAADAQVICPMFNKMQL